MTHNAVLHLLSRRVGARKKTEFCVYHPLSPTLLRRTGHIDKKFGIALSHSVSTHGQCVMRYQHGELPIGGGILGLQVA